MQGLGANCGRLNIAMEHRRRKPRLAESPDICSVNIIDDAKLLASGAKEHEDPDFDPNRPLKPVRRKMVKRKGNASEARRNRSIKRINPCPPRTMKKRPRHGSHDVDVNGTKRTSLGLKDMIRARDTSMAEQRIPKDSQKSSGIEKVIRAANGLISPSPKIHSLECTAPDSSNLTASASPSLKRCLHFDTTSDESSSFQSPCKGISSLTGRPDSASGAHIENVHSSGRYTELLFPEERQNNDAKPEKVGCRWERTFLSCSRSRVAAKRKRVKKKSGVSRGLGDEFDFLNRRGLLEKHLREEERLLFSSKKRGGGRSTRLTQLRDTRKESTPVNGVEVVTLDTPGCEPAANTGTPMAGRASPPDKPLKVDTDDVQYCIAEIVDPSDELGKTGKKHRTECFGTDSIHSSPGNVHAETRKQKSTECSIEVIDEHLQKLKDNQKNYEVVELSSQPSSVYQSAVPFGRASREDDKDEHAIRFLRSKADSFRAKDTSPQSENTTASSQRSPRHRRTKSRRILSRIWSRRSVRLQKQKTRKAGKVQDFIDLTLESNDSVSWDEESPFAPYSLKAEPAPVIESLLSNSPAPRKVKKTTPLNTEERTIVKEITKGNSNSPIVTIDEANITLTRRDMSHLRGTRWLHDEIMNCYVALLNKRNSEFFAASDRKIKIQQRPRTFIFNTYFYTRLTDTGYNFSGVRRWTRRAKVDILKLDLVLVPINLGNAHWILAGVNFGTRRILYLDSMHSNDQTNVVANLRKWLYDELCDKHGEHRASKIGVTDFLCRENYYQKHMDNGSNVKEHVVPRQYDSGSCGVFTAQFAACLEKGQLMKFRQSNVANLRARMALELFYKQIL